MAMRKEQPAPADSPALSQPIELITENGFSIVRADEISGATPSFFGEYRFLVRDTQHSELEVVVRISPESVIEIIWRSLCRISSDSTYWICCAERHLADYLWQNNHFPPAAELWVEPLTLCDLNLARTWGTS
jgi:hypothetical protein